MDDPSRERVVEVMAEQAQLKRVVSEYPRSPQLLTTPSKLA